MKTLTKNTWILFTAIMSLGLLMVSCDDDDDEPDPVNEPTASFTFEATGLAVKFTNTSENGISYAWDFGDESSSTDLNPEHTYTAAGDYMVKLTVTGESGSTPSETTQTVTVADIDPCEGWEKDQNNLLAGGSFEACDEQFWTVVKSTQPETSKYEFGYTEYKPTSGTDGALYIFPDNDATEEEEGTIMYQELTLEAGEYQLSAQVKLGGENQDDPTSAMHNYWFQFYMGTDAPTDGNDYNSGQVSGWFYGGWTGWAYEIPPTDGPLVHTYVAANLANEEGKWSIAEGGTYYFVVKFGKGDGTFGDGIALDDLLLTRIGEPNECFIHDGTEDGNLIKGGNFDECDEKYWSVLKANLEEFPVQFGYTDYAPSEGENGGLYFNNPESTKLAENVGTAGTIYQYVGELDAGEYQLSALIKQGGVDGGNHQFWWEMYLWSEEPVEELEYQPKESDAEDALKVRPLAGYTHAGWGPRPDLGAGTATVAVDGELQYGYNVYDLTDAEGKFTIDAKNHYFFVFKFGTWVGSFGEGITIDKLRLSKVE